MWRPHVPARWEWPLERLAGAAAVFGSIPLALWLVYLLGGLSLFASQPTWAGGAPLVAAFAAALAFGDRVWPTAFQRQVVVASLLSSFVTVTCLYAGGYLLPLLPDANPFAGSLRLAITLALVVYLAGCAFAAGEADVEDAQRVWMGAGAAGMVAFYATLLGTA